jgi:uncharacterized protein YacL
MSWTKHLIRSIKMLQFACLGTFVAIVASALLVLWAFPWMLSDLKEVLGAISQYVLPMFGAAFFGEHVKNLSEAVKSAAENKAKTKADDVQGVVG